MIRKFKGDLLDALETGNADCIIHQVNCLGIMGGGIAKQIKERFPSAFDVYTEEYLAGRLKPGSHSMSPEGIFNVAGQASIGKGLQTDYSATVIAFCDIFLRVDISRKTKKLILGVPWKYGCGLGGGDWKVMRPLIEHYLSPAFKEIHYYDITGEFNG